MTGLRHLARAGFDRRAVTTWAVALGLVFSASAVTGCGRSDKQAKQTSAEHKPKKKKKQPKAAELPPLSVDCAAPVDAHTYELPKLSEEADLRAPATEGPVQLSAGPMLGAVSSQSVKVWLRMDRPAPYRVTIWPTKGSKKKRVVEGALPAQEHDFSSTLEIGELTPATAYTYQVEVGPAGKDAIKLPQRSFRTLAAEGAAGKLRFAVGGNIAGDIDGKIFSQIAETSPDFLMLLGDLIYADDIKSPTFAAFAAKYERNWNVPELKELTQNVPTFMIWDDHEIKKGYYSGSSTKRYVPARLAYHFYAQAHNPTPAHSGATHYQFRAGDVSFFVADVRSHRRNPKDADDGTKTMLGDDQKAELARFLKCDPSKVKVIFSPVMWGGPAAGNQSWTAYKAERNQILSFIEAEQIDNVIIVSGDQQWSALLKHERPKTTLYELLATPLSKDLKGSTGASKSVIARDDDHHVFGVVDIDTTATPATIAFTLCARGKPCKPGEEPAPTTALDVEGEQENVPFTVKITDEELGVKEKAPVAAEAAKDQAPAAPSEAAKTAAPKPLP